VLCALLGVVLFAGMMLRHRSSSRLTKQALSPALDKQPVTFAMHTFDPAAPPADMPPLASGAEAECDSNFIFNANVKGRSETVDGKNALVTVTEIRVTLQLRINSRVPGGATQ